MTANIIEIAVAHLLDFRAHTIVPNISWGLGLNHECDMLAIDKKKRFTEIEIKISASDLKADFNKEHGHRSKIISRLIYAMPEELYKTHGHLVPKPHGIIAVETIPRSGINIYKAKWRRQCQHNVIQTPTEHQIHKFMSLGCMRIWTLKDRIQYFKERVQYLKNKTKP